MFQMFFRQNPTRECGSDACAHLDTLFQIMVTDLERAKSMREMNAHRVTITMTNGNVFSGYINIGSCRRLTDFFGKSDNSRFVVMFDTTIGESQEKGVYFIYRAHILSVEEPN